MKLKIVIVFAACISCLVPPAFSIGILATKALAVGAAKGATAIAIKGAILKGAALLAKGAAIKGAAALAAKGILLTSAAVLGAKTLKAGALIAGSKLSLPPVYVLQKPYTPEKDFSQKPSAIDESQKPYTPEKDASPKPCTSAIEESQNSSVTETYILQKPSDAQSDVVKKLSDLNVSVSQNSSDLELNVLQKPTDLATYNLQKPVDVHVYDSQESAVEDEDFKPQYVLPPVIRTDPPVSDKLPGIMGILQSAVQNKTDAVNNFLRALHRPLFVKQPIIYQIVKRPNYPAPVLDDVAKL